MRAHPPAGVLYAEDFDAPEPAADAAPAPVPASPAAPVVVVEPTFSLADLRHAAARAQEEGRALAREDAALAAEARRAEAASAVAAALQRSLGELEAVARRAASATADTVLAAVAALLPALARSRARDETASLLRLLLPAMAHEPELAIRVHPTLVEGLRQDLAAVLEDGRTAVSWVGTDSMPPGDVSVRWNNGAMTRDTADLCARIAALVMPDAPSDTSQESQDGQ